MPPLIGEVVSDVMYEGQLQSNPDHPIPSTQPSCWFIHTEDSRESQHDTSWHASLHSILFISSSSQVQHRTLLREPPSLNLLRSSRKKTKSTALLPPMMLSVISWKMTSRLLVSCGKTSASMWTPSKARHFNSPSGIWLNLHIVGNEKDYIVVSLVRSHGLGFLDDKRRTNVMLTRCKRGMYIVTSWEFVWQRAYATMVGRMAAAWGDEAWVTAEHVVEA